MFLQFRPHSPDRKSPNSFNEIILEHSESQHTRYPHAAAAWLINVSGSFVRPFRGRLWFVFSCTLVYSLTRSSNPKFFIEEIWHSPANCETQTCISWKFKPPGQITASCFSSWTQGNAGIIMWADPHCFKLQQRSASAEVRLRAAAYPLSDLVGNVLQSRWMSRWSKKEQNVTLVALRKRD